MKADGTTAPRAPSSKTKSRQNNLRVTKQTSVVLYLESFRDNSVLFLFRRRQVGPERDTEVSGNVPGESGRRRYGIPK